MVLIITDSDQDGAYCAGYLGQLYTVAKFYIGGSPAEKILSTRERDLIIIADLEFHWALKEAVLRKLQKVKSLRVIIFDHHSGTPEEYRHPRVEIYKTNSINTHAYYAVKKFVKGRKE